MPEEKEKISWLTDRSKEPRGKFYHTKAGIGFLSAKLQDLQSPFEDELKEGWYRPGTQWEETRLDYKGEPTSFEEAQWILNYIGEQGAPPTPQEAARWRSGHDREDWTYRPESTMGKLGWESPGEYQRFAGNVRYGPHGGGLVPEEGVVLTDQFGNPLYRTFDYQRAKPHIEKGRYIPMGEQGLSEYQRSQMGMEEAPPSVFKGDSSQYYPEPVDVKPFEPPSFVEFLSGSYVNPGEMYKARLQDYFADQMSRAGDLGERKAILSEQQKAVEQIRILQQTGASPEQYPFYEASRRLTAGQNTQNLYNQHVEFARKNWQASMIPPGAPQVTGTVQPQNYYPQPQQSYQSQEEQWYPPYTSRSVPRTRWLLNY